MTTRNNHCSRGVSDQLPAGYSIPSVDEQLSLTCVRLPLYLEPAVELTATHPDAAADSDQRDLPFGDQLVGPTPGYPQDLSYLRDLQVLEILVHVYLRLAFMCTSILVRLPRLRYRKSEDLGFPGTGTRKGEHVGIGERPRNDPSPAEGYRHGEGDKLYGPCPDPSTLGGERRAIRIPKHA